MTSAEIFREIIAALDHAAIPYMMVGSFASNLYGTGRATFDIDLVVSATPEQVRTLLSLLPTDKYYFDLDTALAACRSKDMFNILDMERGWKVDIIFEKQSAYHRQAFQRRTEAEIEKVPLVAATAEDTIISKLEWAKMGESSRQIEDVAGILRVRGESLDRPYINRWVKDLDLSDQWNHARRLAGLE
jgi:predicted nucleotidyltransferase